MRQVATTEATMTGGRWVTHRVEVCGACLTWVANGDDSCRDLLPDDAADRQRSAMFASIEEWHTVARDAGGRGALMCPMSCLEDSDGAPCGCAACEGSDDLRGLCDLCACRPGTRYPVQVDYREAPAWCVSEWLRDKWRRAVDRHGEAWPARYAAEERAAWPDLTPGLFSTLGLGAAGATDPDVWEVGYLVTAVTDTGDGVSLGYPDPAGAVRAARFLAGYGLRVEVGHGGAWQDGASWLAAWSDA